MSGRLYRKPIGYLHYSQDEPRAFNWVTVERDGSDQRLSLSREEVYDLHYALGRTIAALEAEERKP
jgi:hypothetical protein